MHAGAKNIMRGFFLAFLATFCGCFCFYTLPDAIAAQLGRVMPIWFYEGQVSLQCHLPPAVLPTAPAGLSAPLLAVWQLCLCCTTGCHLV